MSLWRFGPGWSEERMKDYLAELTRRSVNFDVPPEEMTDVNGWKVDGIDAVIGCEKPGPPEPGGLFERAREALMNYDFSDPLSVEGHFDPRSDFIGRNILLEIKVMGLRFLNGARVHSVRDEVGKTGTIFGFRYDTLEGHIERGYEWFLLTKDHETGEIRFKIEAHWRLGDFPNWWSRLGFKLIGEHFRELWRREAPLRLKRAAERRVTEPAPPPGELAHRGDPMPTRSEPRQAVTTIRG
jgi:uncharacterized protein (UPF0548 family)